MTATMRNHDCTDNDHGFIHSSCREQWFHFALVQHTCNAINVAEAVKDDSTMAHMLACGYIGYMAHDYIVIDGQSVADRPTGERITGLSTQQKASLLRCRPWSCAMVKLAAL